VKIAVETVVKAKLNKVGRMEQPENTPELQRTGWQAILDNFGRHVEAKD
jgi:hypothetical protein